METMPTDYVRYGLGRVPGNAGGEVLDGPGVCIVRGRAMVWAQFGSSVSIGGGAARRFRVASVGARRAAKSGQKSAQNSLSQAFALCHSSRRPKFKVRP